MRHRNSGRQLSRNSSHRSAMLKNMAVSLLQHEIIKTTVPKAKELRRVAEPLITMAKSDSVHRRRIAFSRLRDRDTVTKLFNELGPRYRDRPGGYLRILKLAAGGLETDVAEALKLLLASKSNWEDQAVAELVQAPPKAAPELAQQAVNLAVYDQLLSQEACHVSA